LDPGVGDQGVEQANELEASLIDMILVDLLRNVVVNDSEFCGLYCPEAEDQADSDEHYESGNRAANALARVVEGIQTVIHL